MAFSIERRQLSRSCQQEMCGFRVKEHSHGAELAVQDGVTISQDARIYTGALAYVWLALCKKPSEQSSWDAGTSWA